MEHHPIQSTYGIRYSDLHKSHCVDYFLRNLEDGMDEKECYLDSTRVFGPSESTIRDWLAERNTQLEEEIQPPPPPLPHQQQQQQHEEPPPNKVFTDDELNTIKYFYELQSDLFSDEMCTILFMKFGKVCNEKQMDKARRELNLTSKLLEQKSHEKNDLLREYWRQCIIDNLDEIPSYMYLFVDETHLTPEETLRRHGVSKRGKPAYSSHWLCHKGEPGCSGIVSMSIEGIRSISTYGENVDANTFLDALENDILPHTTPFPGPRSILCLDNAKVHLKPAIFNLCHEKGVIALFLPQYSYDMTPIEPVFHLAKAYIRRVWGHSHPEAVDHPLQYQLEISLRNCLTSDVACNEFNNVDMNVTEWERAWANR
jgi:transposase